MLLQSSLQPISLTTPPEDWRNGGFGLYVHWPFCAAKCPYCDFNSHVTSTVDHQVWADALVAELRRTAAEVGSRTLDSIYFGGGTPSLMAPSTVARIIETALTLWTPSQTIEITLEANPTSVEAQKFAEFRLAGVNRVSLGVQALNDQDLKALGRLHSADQAIKALETARKTFDRVSFDLIYARQNQSHAEWKAELEQALALAPDHLSLYQLTIEPGTAFGDRFRRGKLPGLPDEDLSVSLYSLTQEICQDAGLRAYEVSNYAREGAESRHNLIYWRYGDYAGIGPGAHGRLTLGGQRLATETALAPQAWLERVDTLGSGETLRAGLSPADQGAEYALMSLRLTEGMDLARYADLTGQAIAPENISQLKELGLVTLHDSVLVTTPQGRLLLNSVLAELLTNP